jgi:hypothetical protein
MVSALPQSNLNGEFCDSTLWRETAGNSEMPHAAAYRKENDELTFKSLEKSIFELQDTEASADHRASSCFNSSEVLTSCSLANVPNSRLLS